MKIKACLLAGFLCLPALFALETVENGLEPTNPLPFSVTRDLVFGVDVDAEGQDFAYGVMATGASNGTMFVIDPGNHRVIMFDKDGAFVKQFGTMGQGPGEFQEIAALAVTPDNRLVVFDTGSKRLSFFSAEGAYESSVNFAPNIQAIFTPVVLDNGHVAAGVLTVGNTGQMVYTMDYFNASMESQRTFFSIPQPAKDWSKMNEPGFWEDFLVDQFTVYGNGLPITGALGKDRFIVGRTNLYEGEVADQAGKTLYNFNKAFKPKPMTDEAKRLIFEEMWQAMSTNPFLSQRMPQPVFEKALGRMTDLQVSQPLIAFFPLGDGFAAIAERDPVTAKGRVDYFDAEGKLRATAPFEGPSYFVSGIGSTIYASGLDEEENVVIYRYKVEGL